MAFELTNVFIKILWRLFQLHLLLFMRTYALNIHTTLSPASGRACQSPRLSNCPIMRTKQFFSTQANLLHSSFRLSMLSSSAESSSRLSMTSPRSMLLYMSSRDNLLSQQLSSPHTHALTGSHAKALSNSVMHQMPNSRLNSQTRRQMNDQIWHDYIFGPTSESADSMRLHAQAQTQAYETTNYLNHQHNVMPSAPAMWNMNTMRPMESTDVGLDESEMELEMNKILAADLKNADSAKQLINKHNKMKNANAFKNRVPVGVAVAGREEVPLGDLEVVALGLSHHTAGVEVREKLAIPEAEWRHVASELCGHGDSGTRLLPKHIHEASVLSTCNRFEIYLAVPRGHVQEAVDECMDYLIARAVTHKGASADSLTKESLRPAMFVLQGDKAIHHLLRVSAGLDSLVVGEAQILAQVKRSHELCALSPAPAVADAPSTSASVSESVNVFNPAGKMLSKVLNTAIAAGKRARTETGIAKGAVSISSAAAQFTCEHVARDCAIEHLSNAHVCVIGAGKMARLLLVHLRTEGVRAVTVVNRSPNNIEELRREFPDMEIRFALMDQLWDVIADSDVVFPSTSSKVHVITPEPLMGALAKRNRPGGLQIIDISVPRNVDPACSDIPGVFNYNVDFLKAAVDRNTALRQREIIEVEALLQQELNRFSSWKQSLAAVPTITDLLALGDAVRQGELAKVLPGLSNKLTEAEMNAVEKCTRNIVQKLLHGPLKALRGSGSGSSTGSKNEQQQIKEQSSESNDRDDNKNKNLMMDTSINNAKAEAEDKADMMVKNIRLAFQLD